METKRQRRRRDLQRMKAKARRVRPHDPKAKQAEHLASCSCWMCGNPRRAHKGAERITVQERMAHQTVVIAYDGGTGCIEGWEGLE